VSFTGADKVMRARATRARTFGVDTVGQAVATAVASIALVNIDATRITITRVAVGAWRADTTCAASVDTTNKGVTATLTICGVITLIVVDTASETSAGVELRAVRAVERTLSVNTISVGIARIVIALIDINTLGVTTAVISSGWAVTAVAGSRGVGATYDISTTTVVDLAFIDVNATEGTRAIITTWARTTSNTTNIMGVVGTSGESIAVAIVGITTVVGATSEASSNVSRRARRAIEAACVVHAGRNVIASTVQHEALVDIPADEVTIAAPAGRARTTIEATSGVVASSLCSAATVVGITFVDINATVFATARVTFRAVTANWDVVDIGASG